jgi:hypothetical protein
MAHHDSGPLLFGTEFRELPLPVTGQTNLNCLGDALNARLHLIAADALISSGNLSKQRFRLVCAMCASDRKLRDV